MSATRRFKKKAPVLDRETGNRYPSQYAAGNAQG